MIVGTCGDGDKRRNNVLSTLLMLSDTQQCARTRSVNAKPKANVPRLVVPFPIR